MPALVVRVQTRFVIEWELELGEHLEFIEVYGEETEAHTAQVSNPDTYMSTWRDRD